MQRQTKIIFFYNFLKKITKLKILLIFLLLFCVNFANAQPKIDTIYTLDSIWQNDTLYIIKTMHLKVLVSEDEKNKNIIQEKDKKPPQIIHKSLLPKKECGINYLKVSPIFEFGFFRTKNTNNFNVLDSINNLYYASYGIEANLRNRFFNYSLGVQYSKYKDYFSINDFWKTIDTSLIQNIKESTFWQVDTIWYLDTDSLLVGDSVWRALYDSTKITEYDTNYTFLYDTIHSHNVSKRKNTIRYIDIPVKFGYYFRKNNFWFYLNTGLVFGFPIYNNYQIEQLKNEGIIKGIFTDINYWFYNDFSLEYRLNKNLSLKIGTFVKIPLNNQILLLNSKRKYFSYGVNFRFNWQFFP